MGQLISDVTDILNYQDSKKQAKNTRQEILAEMARDDAQRTNLVKKFWRHNVLNTVHPVCLVMASPKVLYYADYGMKQMHHTQTNAVKI